MFKFENKLYKYTNKTVTIFYKNCGEEAAGTVSNLCFISNNDAERALEIVAKYNKISIQHFLDDYGDYYPNIIVEVDVENAAEAITMLASSQNELIETYIYTSIR